MTGEDLRALSAAATPGPWDATGHMAGPGVPDMWTIANPEWDLGAMDDQQNAELIVWLRNHADALADLADAASKLDPLGEHRPIRTIPTQCADCLNAWPCPTENVRAALAALDADT